MTERKIKNNPKPKGKPAAIGAIQWTDIVLPVHANQNNAIGKLTAPISAENNFDSGALRIRLPFSSLLPLLSSGFLGLYTFLKKYKC
ncbi:uncharacterized protein PRCAT00001443001 [Priceomyces carsonii]|uniref:uncharacterized protein n=1 Tax=Priceomyces carsonii TaxID=28549 RepID=UPI002ED85C73|nr:unnamed protein product [Priceomyces carsonii]